MDLPIKKIVVIQTAFIGDAILTLPLIQVLKNKIPDSSIDVVVIPKTAEIFQNHPAISKIIPFDKRGSDKGLIKLARLGKEIRNNNYDLALVPHRSIRSAALARFAKPKRIIGFDRSAGSWLFTDVVNYEPSAHEMERNFSLLGPLGFSNSEFELPRLYPSKNDIEIVDGFLKKEMLWKNLIAIAPGTIWNTKRWPEERFAAVCKKLASEGFDVVLVGSADDERLCSRISQAADSNKVHNYAGKFSLLQSAWLIRCCRILISNDSAPMHLAVSVGTPVIAIFGATVPEFGFAPRGPHDIVMETKGLKCRPCSIHGGDKCPIKTFDCMIRITPEDVIGKARQSILNRTSE